MAPQVAGAAMCSIFAPRGALAMSSLASWNLSAVLQQCVSRSGVDVGSIFWMGKRDKRTKKGKVRFVKGPVILSRGFAVG